MSESPLDSLAFNWMTPLMQLGAQRFIVQEDLDDLDPDDASGNLGKKLQYYWDREVATKNEYVYYTLSWYIIPVTLRCTSRVINQSGRLSGAHYSTPTAAHLHSPLFSKCSPIYSNSANPSCSDFCLPSSLPTSVIRLARPFSLDLAGPPHSSSQPSSKRRFCINISSCVL